LLGEFVPGLTGASTPKQTDIMTFVSLNEIFSPGVTPMTGNAQKQILRLFGLIVAILLLCGINSAVAQDKPSPLSDYQYKIDLPKYELIKKEADAQKRADLLLGFIKERQISRLLLNAVSDYLECIKPQMQSDPAKAVTLIEGLMALLLNEETVKAANIPAGTDEYIKNHLVQSRKVLLAKTYELYLQAKNYPKAAETLEKIYAMTPDKSLLPALADVYKASKNEEKYIAYSQKVLAEIPIEQSYATALDMAQISIQKNDLKTAIDLFTKILAVYGDKVPPTFQEPQWNATRAFAYGLIATQIVYPTKDYPKIIEAFEKVLKFDPKSEEAHYFIGRSKWQLKDQPGAIESFIKCVAINGPNYAAKAKPNLESLYKAEHNGSLDGLDQAIAKAKSDLGIK
jgi:tetratricopeptide (TPR) repeat protein